uniref:Cytochrome c oxidase assembly protein COX11, mitochondrial n=1 Tax=Wuchereria bancrofti TaxID=6293 RepID=A0AAF5PZJ9_WUCBA
MLTLIRAAICGINHHRSLLILCNSSLLSKQPCRIFTNWAKRYIRSKNAMYYLGSVGVLFFSFAVLSVPAYRMFCEKTATIGLTKIADDMERVASMEKIKDRLIRVSFNADLHSAMKWQFKPLQKEIYVHPGETALVFYSAYNPTDKPVVGISSYNITPFQAAYYFNKIQCFCFEDQILNPGEQVDLPVFFYIDPDYTSDPDLEYTDSLILSYTFFESKPNLVLPDPFDPNNKLNIKRNASNVSKEMKKN